MDLGTLLGLVEKIPVEWLRRLFGKNDSCDCRHCEGTGTCRNVVKYTAPCSCQSCLKAAGVDHYDNLVACAICGGTGRWQPPTSPSVVAGVHIHGAERAKEAQVLVSPAAAATQIAATKAGDSDPDPDS